MKKLAEIRSQELICRERAMLDSERKVFWLAQAEEWEQRALDEIAFYLGNAISKMGKPSRPHTSAGTPENPFPFWH